MTHQPLARSLHAWTPPHTPAHVAGALCFLIAQGMDGTHKDRACDAVRRLSACEHAVHAWKALSVCMCAPHPALHTQVVGHLQLAMAVGAGTAAVMGVVVLPTLAADEMRERVAEAVRGAGVTAARYLCASKVSKAITPQARVWSGAGARGGA